MYGHLAQAPSCMDGRREGYPGRWWHSRFLPVSPAPRPLDPPVEVSLPLSAEARYPLGSPRKQKNQAFCVESGWDTVVTKPPPFPCQLPPGILCPYPMSPPVTLNEGYSLGGDLTSRARAFGEEKKAVPTQCVCAYIHTCHLDMC